MPEELTHERTRPRVWLVGGNTTSDPAPGQEPAVRTDLMREWRPTSGGGYVTVDGRHRATWRELRARYDLVEVA